MMKSILVLVLIVMAVPVFGQSLTAGTNTASASISLTVTEDVLRNIETSRYYMLVIDWISHTDGKVNATLDGVNGELLRVSYNPGSTTPTASYDMTLKDADGYDAFRGNGANLSDTANSEAWIPDATSGYIGFPMVGAFTLAIESAGSKTNGAIRMYLRR